MDDFSIRISNLPFDHMFDNNEYLINACIIQHFQKVIKEQLSETEALDSQNWEVVDINYGKSDMSYIQFYNQLNKIRDKFLKNEQKIKTINDFDERNNLKEINENEKLSLKFDEIKQKYFKESKKEADINKNK